MRKMYFFLSEFFQFLKVKFSIYLNWPVFVMYFCLVLCLVVVIKWIMSSIVINLLGEQEAGCFVFRWFVSSALSVLGCLLCNLGYSLTSTVLQSTLVISTSLISNNRLY